MRRLRPRHQHAEQQARPATLTWVSFAGRALLSFAFTSVTTLAAWSFIVPLVMGWDQRVIISGSMEPKLRPGDIVIYVPGTPEPFKPGEVALFRDPNDPASVLTHRLIEKNEDGHWVSKGDANPTPDTSPVKPEHFVGQPKLLVPYIGIPAYWRNSGQIIPLAALGGTALMSVLATPGAFKPRQPRHRAPRSSGPASARTAASRRRAKGVPVTTQIGGP